MAQQELKRQIGLFSAVMLIAGDMIGTGIFISTGVIAETLPSPGGILLVWLLGGLLALTGALSYAELSASLPYAGGDYIYIREAYGKLMGFLSGWSSFPRDILRRHRISRGKLERVYGFLFPGAGFRNGTLFFGNTMGADYGHCGDNICHHRSTALIRPALPGRASGHDDAEYSDDFKIGALLGIILFGILFGRGDTAHFVPLFDWQKVSFSVFAAAFIPVIFAYSGWNAITYIAGEVKDPERNLPRALLFGVLIVTALYLAINAVYIYAVPVTEMKGALRVSEVATTALFGYQTSALITAIITISILGALNVVTMIGPRIYYAMAQDGVLFKGLGRVHPRFGTPTSAIILQAVWACLLILTNTWGTLFTYVSVVITLFSAFTVGSVIVLRYKRPELKRPYKIWGYPIVPLLFILIHLWIVWGSVKEKPFESLVGVFIVAARHSDLFRLAVAPPDANSEFGLQIVERELFTNGYPHHESLHQDRR